MNIVPLYTSIIASLFKIIAGGFDHVSVTIETIPEVLILPAHQTEVDLTSTWFLGIMVQAANDPRVNCNFQLIFNVLLLLFT